MSAILEAVEVVTDAAGKSPPLSLEVARGEIVGLLFPEGRSRKPLLRALAGLDAPRGGQVRVPRRKRIVLAGTGAPLAAALSPDPDLVVLDAGNEHSPGDTWTRIAYERARGTSFLVGTSSVDLAYRSDRVSLAEWDPSAATLTMSRYAQEFVAIVEACRDRYDPAVAAELRRLNRAARDVLAEQQRLKGRNMAFDAELREDRDRRRIAANLHDGVSQTLALVQLRLADARASTDGPVHDKLEDCRTLIDQAIEEIRNVTFDLSPPVLHDLGLQPALELLAEQMDRRYGLEMEVDGHAGTDVDPAAAPTVFRAIRELVTNVSKHAKVGACKVTLRRSRAQLAITVTDHGVGFGAPDTPRRRGGFGLSSVREQIERLGGRIDVQSSPGRGTRVTMLIRRRRRPP